MSDQPADQLLASTVDIVSAYVANNAVAVADLGALITQVHATLKGLDKNSMHPEGNHNNLVPAVPVKKSIMPDYLICLEDGKKLKMLKRHLKARYNMTPESYRERWGLPPDYPMVAPNYANQRRSLAKEIGLGRGKRRNAKR
jgi:predicted transcriptional regulator